MEGLTLQATRTFSPSQNSLTWRRRSILSSKPRASALRFEPATNRNANISLLSSAISLQSNFFGHRVSSRPRLPEPTRAVNKPTVAADKPASALVAWQGAKPVPLAISLAIGIIVRFLVPKPVEVTPQAWQLLSIFLSTIAGLVLSPLPVGAWAFLGLTTAVITRTLSFSAAFSAFTNEVIWLIVISFFFARGFVKTGLGDRIATYFVKWLGKSTLGLSYGLTVSEALIAPAMPSTTARAGGVFLPIIKSLSLSGGSLPNDKSSEKLGSYLIQSQFQIVNHGVPQIVMKNMMEIAKEFFEMPVEDRACLYSEDPKQTVRLSKSFTNKENVLNWRESLSHAYHPVVMNSWPEKPAAYREIAAKYCMNVKALALRLLAAISEALGLDSDYLNTSFGKHIQSMVINYYPPCPNPDLTLGIPGHSDGSGITVLMQGDVDGLQVLKNGKWVAVQPIDNAFVINLGDLLQVVSNGRFKSVEHRAVTNASTARISIPTFYGPSLDALVAPAGSMVDEQHPALYRGFKVEEFVRVAYGSELKCKKLLDHFKIEYPQYNGE